MLRFLRTFVLALAACFLLAQEPLNNEGVIKLVKSGMTEDLILNVIHQQPGVYTMSATDLVTLKESGVSEKIIAAMLAKTGTEPSSAAAGTGTAHGSEPRTQQRATTEPGLYYKKGNEYFELLSEPIEWKTKGALKNALSAGIVKKDLKGILTGVNSRNFLKHPVEILLSPPPGVTVNSYVLLPLTVDKGVRKFNLGKVNRQTGVAKGAIAYGVEKVGENSFRVVLSTPLPPGEYGILRVEPDEADKMFTFRIIL